MAKRTVKVVKATPDALDSVAFFREHGSQLLALINRQHAPVNYPGLRPPIVAVLLQPVSNGDRAKALVLQSTNVRNAFRIDMYGYFQSNNLFKFRVKGATYNIDGNGNVLFQTRSELFYTAPILAKTATAEVMKKAIVATGGVSDSDLDVSVGNLVVMPTLIQNQALAYLLSEINPGDRPVTEMFSFAGCWYLAFKSGQLQNKAMSIEMMTEAGSPINVASIQALISTATQLVPGGQIEDVFDIHQTSVMGPLVGGTVVVCIDIPGIGYSIISASPREFFIGSN